MNELSSTEEICPSTSNSTVNPTTLSINKQAFKDGIHDGIPIALGYLAVSFSLGITAKNTGLTAFQGFFTSFLVNASAGEYAGFTAIATSATYLEILLVILIANSRYFIMSCALSQKLNTNIPWYQRMLIGFDVTDELFAISVARSGYLNPYYYFGAMFITLPCWAGGTALGIVIGNLLPIALISAFSVALYGMFLAVIIPPARKHKPIGIFVILSFISSYLANYLPYICELSDATRIIILTVVLASIASILFPINTKDGDNNA